MRALLLILLAGCGRIGFGLFGDDTPGDGAMPADGTPTDVMPDMMTMSTTGLDGTATGVEDTGDAMVTSGPLATANNRLMVAAVHWLGSTTSVINVFDSAGNVYQPLNRANHPTNGSVQLWFANNALGSPNTTVTATFSFPTGRARILVHAYDAVANQNGQGSGFGSGTSAVTPFVGASADSLVVASCFTPAADVTFAAGPNFELAASAGGDSQTEDRVFAAAGTAQGQMTITPSTNYVMAFAVFQR